MKGILLLNGEPYSGAIQADDAYTVCCDGAYRWAKKKVRIDETIGDMDSAGEPTNPAPKNIFPAEKDYTDGELGLSVLMQRGCSPIIIYGGSGGREDHFIGNLHLLYKAHEAGVRCIMMSDTSAIFAASGRIPLGGYCGKTLSVLPFGGDITILGYHGLKYTYPEKLTYGECRGISNICLAVDAYLEIQGTALILVSR
ncbi:MAG: thiamine diphosphokinase [Clostridia bacterium]|nr:thiamine diphosphokinase [Clostridia bacterium]